MLLKTILNNCQRYKSFVYEKAEFVKKKKGQCIHVHISPRKNSRAICSGCRKPASGYDKQLTTRRFEFIPIWGYPVFFLYKMRRVNCPSCGIIVEKVPWSNGKNSLANAYMQFLANWAKMLSWKEVATRFGTSWDKVYRSVEYVVDWGLRHRNWDGITAMGVDEIQWRKGHQYLTLVYQINSECVRLLWIGRERTEESFSRFFDMLGKERCANILHVCSDMWKAYLKVIRERIPQAVHILDRFHIVARINKAIDEVRAGEHRSMIRDGYEPLLTKSRWLLLKHKENLTDLQKTGLKELLKYNLQSVRAYLLKEEFRSFWNYVRPFWAGKFLDRWVTKVMRSKINPMKREAKTVRRHKELILNWFRAKKQFSSGIVEGLNNKVKLTIRKSYGFKRYKSIEIALYHSLGKLPEPPITHTFY